MSEWTHENWQERYGIVYKCQISVIYHRKRERFFSLLDKLTTTLALVAGAGAMTDLLSTLALKSLAGAAVTAVTLPALVFAWSDKARTHGLLASKFAQLQAEIEGAGVLNAQQLDKFKERALSLEIEEPPQLSALTRICQNEVAYAMGALSSVKPLGFLERQLAPFLDMPVKVQKQSLQVV